MNKITKIYTTNKEKFEDRFVGVDSSLRHNITKLQSHNKQLVLEVLEGLEHQIKSMEHEHDSGMYGDDQHNETLSEVLTFLHSAKEEIQNL